MKIFVHANNHLIEGHFDETKPETYIIYLDANNLYGWSMMQNLPYRDFKWFTEEELSEFNKGGHDYMLKYINEIRPRVRGFFVEVKLEYPEELHEKHNLYPLAPERRCVKEEEVSYLLGDCIINWMLR